MRAPAPPEATVRGVAVGVVSFVASLMAHAVAMGMSAGGSTSPDGAAPSAPMSGHEMHDMPGHDMGSMTSHDMASMGDMSSMHGMGAMHHTSGATMPDMPMPMPGTAAHAMAPTIPLTSMLLLAVVCAVIGALAARPRAAGPALTAALALAGQGAGHLALGITMGHLAITPTMAFAHVAAAVVAGVAIAGAESALRLALAALRPLAPRRSVAPRTVVAPVWTFRAVPVPAVACHGALRGPPL